MITRSFAQRLALDHATAYIELLMVLPVLMMLVFGGYAASRSIATSNKLKFLARVVGVKVMRDCLRASVLNPPGPPPFDTSLIGTSNDPVYLCLQNDSMSDTGGILTTAQREIPELRLIASVYEIRLGTTVLRARRLIGPQVPECRDRDPADASRDFDNDGDTFANLADSDCSGPDDDSEGPGSNYLSRFNVPRVDALFRDSLIRAGSIVIIEAFNPRGADVPEMFDFQAGETYAVGIF